MAYINIYIVNPCRISVKNKQLVLEGDKKVTYPIEDINSIVIENRQIVMSAYSINNLTKSGAVIFACNETHLPDTIILPFNRHTRKLKQLKSQLSIPKPITKQLWKTIVKQKIVNQAKCLQLCSKEYKSVIGYADNICSGDSTNQESAAAREYFRVLFGNSFRRQDDNAINAALNYGYSIIRGLIARSIVAHGFEPSIGIFHCNELNNFNLADDLIEPFRPLVDMLIYENFERIEILDTQIKKAIYNLVNCDVVIKNQRHSVSNAVDMVVESLVNSCSKKANYLCLPELINIKMHEYE